MAETVISIGAAMGLEPITEPHSKTVVRVEDDLAKRQARRQWWADQLVHRYDELVQWLHINICGHLNPLSEARKARLVEMGASYPPDFIDGGMLLDADMPAPERKGQSDRELFWALSHALSSIRKAEYEAREARRKKREEEMQARIQAARDKMAQRLFKAPGHNTHRKGGRFTNPDPNGWHCGHRSQYKKSQQNQKKR